MEKNYKIIPFDIEKAKAGAEVVTRNGRSAKIICYDKKVDTEITFCPIVALISYINNNGTPYELAQSYTVNGRIDNNADNSCDLVLKIPVKTRRMTNQELAWWLRDSPEEYRELKDKNGYTVFQTYEYMEINANEPLHDGLLIRSNGGEWKEPLIEINE